MSDVSGGLRPIRSFVRREGRLTPAQQRALTELWPHYGLEPADGPLDLARAFGRRAPAWLEIGFGNGDVLRQLAARHPEVNLVGIEVHRPGVGHLLNGLAAEGLDNVRVIRADAAEVVRNHVADATFQRVMILFPDPWPKKRHHKRRLIQPAFADQLARVLAPGGILHLATDWHDYATHMREVIGPRPEFAPVDPPPSERPPTRFERRGEARGHALTELFYRRG